MAYTFLDSDDDAVTLGTRRAPVTFDVTSVLVTVMLVALGLISIYSATYDSGASEYFSNQLKYAIVGLILMFITSRLPERVLSLIAVPAYVGTILLLVAVLVVGKTVYGSKSWLVLGPIQFQPSELAKTGTLLMAARYLARRGVDLKNIRDFAVLIGIFAVPVGLIMGEPDFGSATVFVAMLLGLMLWGGVDLLFLYVVVMAPILVVASFFSREVMIVFLALVGGGVFLFRRNIILSIGIVAFLALVGLSSTYVYSVMKPHQKSRIESFLNPDVDPRGKGYHVIQSIMAVGSGGVTGKGFMQGTQTQLRYIPKQWTDFIFCVPTEEFGFIGGVLVISLLGGLIIHGVVVANSTNSILLGTLCFGVSTQILYHTMVNVGMALGLFPVMGIPLPFLSAGGSSLVANLAAVGFILNAFRFKRKARRSAI